jgi:multiple sugar transport system ATP-binding protein
VQVDLVEQLGDQTMLYAQTKGGQALTIALTGQQNIASGTTVTAYVDPARYHVFNAEGRAL